MTPLHERLRAATAAAHAGLERIMALDAPGLTAARYGAALQVLHAVRAGWEPGIEAVLPGSMGPHRGWLESDLAYLGLPPLEPAAALPLEGAAAGWGVRYVLEGSALGGRMLLRKVAPLGFDEAEGARYFAGYGERTGSAWRGFLAELERSADPDGVVRGAETAFAALAAFSETHLVPA